jgi:hypothetical protein
VWAAGTATGRPMRSTPGRKAMATRTWAGPAVTVGGQPGRRGMLPSDQSRLGKVLAGQRSDGGHDHGVAGQGWPRTCCIHASHSRRAAGSSGSRRIAR